MLNKELAKYEARLKRQQESANYMGKGLDNEIAAKRARQDSYNKLNSKDKAVYDNVKGGLELVDAIPKVASPAYGILSTFFEKLAESATDTTEGVSHTDKLKAGYKSATVNAAKEAIPAGNIAGKGAKAIKSTSPEFVKTAREKIAEYGGEYLKEFLTYILDDKAKKSVNEKLGSKNEPAKNTKNNAIIQELTNRKYK